LFLLKRPFLPPTSRQNCHFEAYDSVCVGLAPERKFEQRAREYLLDEDEEDEEEDMAKQVAHMKATGKVLLDGVEYNVEPANSPSQHCATPPSYSGSSG